MNIVHAEFQGTDITFTGDGWFNATAAAAKFGKRPIDWLRLSETEHYIAALCRKSEVGKSHFTLTRKGNSKSFEQGTWLHPKLAVAFARWLDVDFAVWCDSKIDDLLRGQGDWRRMRHESAATYRAMCDVLKIAREAEGKGTAPHHYANEARLVNRVITGEWGGLDRDSLPIPTLDLLAKLEARNLVLLARGVERDERVRALDAFAATWQAKAIPHAA